MEETIREEILSSIQFHVLGRHDGRHVRLVLSRPSNGVAVIEEAERAGCVSCYGMFFPDEVTEYAERPMREEKVVICPHCWSVAVVPLPEELHDPLEVLKELDSVWQSFGFDPDFWD